MNKQTKELVEKQRARNRLEFVEFCVIIVALVAWGTWWYAQLHTQG